MPEPQDDVRIRFGTGGYVHVHHYATSDDTACTIDLTAVASQLASRGASLPYQLVKPTDADGEIQLSLGDGGRALWVNGGGELSAAEVGFAIAAGYNAIDDDESAELSDTITAPCRRERLNVLLRALTDIAGMEPTTARRWLARKRPALGDRSIRQLIDDWRDPQGLITATRYVFDHSFEHAIVEHDKTAALASKILTEELRTPWPAW